MAEKGWKVVRVMFVDRALVRGSAIVLPNEPGFVWYPLEKPAVPRDGFGPLAVFETFAYATRFFECSPPEIAVVPCEFERAHGVLLWEHGRFTKRLHYTRLEACPPGTVLADSVTLKAMLEGRALEKGWR